MADNCQAALIARKFPTQICILRFKSSVRGHNEIQQSRFWTEGLIVSIIDRSVERPQADGSTRRGGQIDAYLVVPEKSNTPIKLTRKLDNETATQVVESTTYEILRDSEIILLPTSEHVREVIRGLFNSEKDGLVDHAVDAIRGVGELRAVLDGMRKRLDTLPVQDDYRKMLGDVAAMKLLVDSAEDRLGKLLAAGERMQTQREARQQERFDAQAARMNELEKRVADLTRTLHGVIETITAPTAEQQAAAPAQAPDAAPAEQQRAAMDPVAAANAYASKLVTMNVGQLYAEYPKLGIPKPRAGQKLDDMRKQLAQAFAERQQA